MTGNTSPLFRLPEDYAAVPNHLTESKEGFYSKVVGFARTVMRLQGLVITQRGPQNLPATGPALVACNHIGYFDFVLAGTVAYLRGRRLIRFMAKKEIFDVPVVGSIMRKMKHISVNRAAGASSMDTAIEALRQGHVVGIFPEGTISRSLEVRELKTGAVRIAHTAGAPIIPMAIWGSQRIWGKGMKRRVGHHRFPIWIATGEPFTTTGDHEADTDRLHTVLKDMVTQLRADYERTYGPFPGGEDWRPASLGGGAPTPEEADAINAAKKAATTEKKRRTT